MTAHDPRVTLTEAEVDRLVFEFGDHTNIYALTDMVAELIAARLAPIRAVAEQWDTGCAREVLAALDAPASASQDHDGAEGHADDCGTPHSLVWCPVCEDEREAERWANEWKKATE